MDSFAVKAIVVVFLSIALYNFLELNAYILTAFKRRSGLYFWSFTVSTWGVAFNSVGYLLKYLHVTSKNNLYSTLILIGWCTMITGQSVVLYSRLHIVMHNRQRLRAVLIMIITNAVWLHIPIIILVYGANSTNPGPYEKPYSIYEKIQLSVFITQELIISGLYLWETTSMLKLERTIGNNGTRIVLRHLLLVNILVILLDLSILGLEFANLFEIQTAWKPLVYSVKLKLEFSILNRLVELTRSARSGDPNASHSYSRNAARSGNLALGTFKGTTVHRSVAQGADTANKWEIHVGAGKQDNPALPSTVIKTTEFKIQSHSRRKSEVSLAESGTEGLVDSGALDEREPGTSGASGASSASSHVRGGSYQDQSWQ